MKSEECRVKMAFWELLLPFSPGSSFFTLHSSLRAPNKMGLPSSEGRSTRRRWQETLRECHRVDRNGTSDACTDATSLLLVRRPSDRRPIRCHGPFDAAPESAAIRGL